MGYSVFESAYQMGTVMVASFEMGRRAAMDKKDIRAELEKIQNIQPIAVMPNDFPFFRDSVLNEKTGEYVPMMYSQMVVSVKTDSNPWQLFVIKFTAFLNIISMLLAIFIFIKLMISINKSIIFNWRNVRRLRWLGGSLILGFICLLIPMCMMSFVLSDVFSLKGYSLQMSEFITVTNLVLGLSALIVGEVFAIGLRMKEEQDLTI